MLPRIENKVGSAAAAWAPAGDLFTSKGGLYHGLGTANAALHLDGPAGAVDLASTAFHAIIGIDHQGFAFLDRENTVRANFDASSASGATVGNEHQGVTGLFNVDLLHRLHQ